MPKRFLGGMTSALFDSDLVATRLALAFAEMCWAIMLFWPFERDHCLRAFESEKLGRHLPKEYQEVQSQPNH